MGALLWLAKSWAIAEAGETNGIAELAVLALLISAAIAVYGGLLAVSGVIGRGKASAAFSQAPDLRD